MFNIYFKAKNKLFFYLNYYAFYLLSLCLIIFFPKQQHLLVDILLAAILFSMLLIDYYFFLINDSDIIYLAILIWYKSNTSNFNFGFLGIISLLITALYFLYLGLGMGDIKCIFFLLPFLKIELILFSLLLACLSISLLNALKILYNFILSKMRIKQASSFMFTKIGSENYYPLLPYWFPFLYCLIQIYY